MHIILSEVTIATFLSSLTSENTMLNTHAPDDTYSCMIGSLSGGSWSAVRSVPPYNITGLLIALIVTPRVHLFLVSQVTKSINLKTGLCRIIIIIVSSVLAGSAVSAAGAIGFVGLVAPHSARMIIGGDYKYLVPLSAIFGGFCLLFQIHWQEQFSNQLNYLLV